MIVIVIRDILYTVRTVASVRAYESDLSGSSRNGLGGRLRFDSQKTRHASE